MLRKGLTCFFLVFTSIVFAQNKTNHWYFGYFAGIDFSDSLPRAVTNGALFTNEGCASIGDSAGALLFYTDGRAVYNKNHDIMQNGTGLLGHTSSTQSSIIVPKPFSDSLYYIFTTDFEGAGNGLRYSVIDMSLKSGLGMVIDKNVSVVTGTCEKVSTIKHANGNDMWILTHLHNSTEIQAYLLTEDGLSSAPVSSHGIFVGSTATYTIGYMKPSHDGSKLAVAHNFVDSLELFDFDRNTGQLFNNMRFGDFAHTGPYGVEFSPNNQLLYVTTEDGSGIIYQYNLIAGSKAAIDSTRVTLNAAPAGINGNTGALQLGPDGKIYVARWFQEELGVISNPNALGVLCDYDPEGFNLDGRFSLGGLPNIAHFAGPGNGGASEYTLSVEHGCENQNLNIEITPYTGDSIRWIFGDGTQLSKSLDYNPVKSYNTDGSYTVMAVIDKPGRIDTLSTIVQIEQLPTLNLGPDTVLCNAIQHLVSLTYTGDTFTWSNGYTGLDTTLTSSATLMATASNGCGDVNDSITVSFVEPSVTLGDDIYSCESSDLTLLAAGNYDLVEWSTGDTDSAIQVNTTGIYTVTATISGCEVTDEIEVNFNEIALDIGGNISACTGDSVQLSVPNQYDSILWNTGDTTMQIRVTGTGMYTLTVIDGQCSATDSVEVTYFTYPDIDLGPDLEKCFGDSVHLDLQADYDNLTWDNGSNDSRRTITTSGFYMVEAANNICASVDSIEIQFRELAIDLGGDISNCEGEVQEIGISETYESMLWNTGETENHISVTSGGIYSLTVSDTLCSSSDSVAVVFNPIPDVDLGEDRTFCGTDDNEIISLNPVYDYTWMDGSTGPEFVIEEIGEISVTAEKEGCTSYDSVEVTRDINCICTVFVPTAFTPNNDLNNDGFKGVSNGCAIDNYRLSIYNRWGERLFESEEMEHVWDGSYKGSNAQQGVYLYLLSYHVDGKSVNTKGTVTLLR